jgi:hypothetical protein
MKKLNILLAGLALALVQFSCTDFNDQFEGLEDMTKPKNLVTYNYTLTEANYSDISKMALAKAETKEDSAKAKSIADYKYFTETVSAADYVPYILESMYKYSDMGSSAMVTYAFGSDRPAYLSQLRSINILNTEDYQLAWGSQTDYLEALTRKHTPAEKLPLVLKSKFPSATEGEFKFVQYEYIDEENPVGQEFYKQDWTDHSVSTSSPHIPISEEGWMTVDLKGELDWQCRVFSGNNFAQASSHNSGAINEAYLISPQIDLTDASGAKFTFDVAVGYWNANCLTVWISDDFDGTESGIGEATWTNLTSNFTLPEFAGGYSPWGNAGVADMSSYEGKKVHIAFKYDGDGRSADDRGDDPLRTTTYQIDNIAISSLPTGENQYVVYNYDGTTWRPADSKMFVALQLADYAAIGKDYFSSADVPLYIPTFLLNKFPYAQAGDVKTVVYRTGSNPTYSGATQYTYNGMEWETEDFIENKTEQFLVSNDGWVFDPTVVYTMVNSDYQIIVDYVKENINENYIDSYGTAEFYYGFGSYYGNVSLRLNYRDPYVEYDTELGALESNEEKIALLHERLREGMEIFTQLRFPEAIPTVSGIEVYYKVTTKIYYSNGLNSADDGFRTYTFKCTAAASGDTPPQFEYISDEVVE